MADLAGLKTPTEMHQSSLPAVAPSPDKRSIAAFGFLPPITVLCCALRARPRGNFSTSVSTAGQNSAAEPLLGILTDI